MIQVAKNELHAELCQRIRTRRKELGLTQVEVAERLGISGPGYNQLETGKYDPTFTTLVALCRALELSISELLAEFVDAH